MTDRPDVLVIGGGPAGATAAAACARAGLRVVLLEAGHHPRPHVGESLLPGIIPILAEIGALADVEAAGFARKTGSHHVGWGTTPRWDLWFSDSDAFESAWFVERARFDAILFDAAVRAGVDARAGSVVRRLHWRDDRIVAVELRDHGGAEHRIEPAAVVDASGAAALVARERGWLEPIAALRHRAAWAHFDGTGRLPAPREHQALFVAERDRWLWHFPLTPTRASVGVVMRDADATLDRETFDAVVAACPTIRELLGPARRITPVRGERDWSYRVRPAAGPHWRLAGDAAGFIDPVLSTGVFLAMHSGWHAARSIRDGRDGDEYEAARRYADHHAAQFDDLLRMVCFFYRQTLSEADYFWESKRILVDSVGPASPRKAFMVLTSGLAANLALHEAVTRRRARATATEVLAPTTIPKRWVCLHVQVPWRPSRQNGGPPIEGDGAPAPDRASVYLVVEPDDPAAPCLARTASFSLDAIAPRLGNDLTGDRSVAPMLRAFVALVRDLDRGGESIPAFWRRCGPALAQWAQALPAPASLVRVLGE